MRASFPLRVSLGLATLAALACGQATTDAIHYKLELELFFGTKSIAGKQTATFKSLVNNLTAVDLDLHSQLKVSSVFMNNKAVTFTRPTNKIHITLDKAYAKNAQFTLTVSYAGKPGPSSSFGGMVFTSHSGSPMCWTLSEPWDAKLWWPGKDVLGDKSTFDMWVTHPNTMSCASNGKLMGVDTLSGNRLRTRWQEKYPIVPYLVSIAVTNYKKRVDTYKGFGANMPVEFYVFPENWNSWQSGLNSIVPILNAFSGAFGQFPFVNEKYGIAQFTWGGGMEHQTITSQSSVAQWLSAHEMGHSWWGDAITCKTWHDIWLNEGFATFSEAVWEERKPGGSMKAYHSWMGRRKPYTASGTVYVYNATSVNRIFNSTNVYRKGGWVVHMLRGALGEKDFWQTLKDYRKAFEGSSASTADFQKSVETTVGRPMGWFFDQWVMKAGAPTYYYSYATRNFGGKPYLFVKIDQTQSARPVFVMPVELRASTSAGSESHKLWNDARNDQFVVPLKAAASSALLDPDQWILRSGVYRKSFTLPFFASTTKEIDVTAGGRAELHFERGSAYKARPYLMLSSLSGTQPGTKVGSITVPLNFDAMTNLGLAALNSAVFAKFLGVLDTSGHGESDFVLPAGLGTVLKGKSLSFAYLLIDKLDTTSTPLTITLR